MPEAERRLAAILSADVVGYSRLMAEDEAATVEALREARTLVSRVVGEHRGRVVDFRGDDFLAEFPTALEAVESAVEIQRARAEVEADVPADRRMRFRIGIHLGDIRAEGERIYGDGVNIAARLEGLAHPGGICVSAEVQGQVRRLELPFEDLGEREVKNIPQPVRVYRILLEDPPRRTTSRRAAILAAAAVILLALAAWATWTFAPRLAFSPLEPGRPVIAVLPFSNMSGDPEQEYFSDGITEDLITDLSKLSGLQVIARNTVFTYKGRAVRIQEVGRELGARYVLEGSVRRSGDRIRVTAQLIDAPSEEHLWAERYDRQVQDIFDVQDDVTAEIIAALELNLTEAECSTVRDRPTESLEAYDFYLRGLAYAAQSRRESLGRAVEMYEKAIEIDPDFAEAHALLAGAELVAYMQQWSDDPDTPRRALVSAHRALELDGNLAAALAVTGMLQVMRGDFDTALEQSRRAVELAPNSSYALMVLGTVLNFAVEPQEAQPILQRSLGNEPEAFTLVWLRFQLGHTHMLLGELESAITAFQSCLALNPDFIPAHLFLAATYVEQGRLEQARSEVGEVLRVNPGYNATTLEGRLRYRDPAVLERFVATLRSAGLPD